MTATSNTEKSLSLVPRSRGAISGVVLIVLGAWGALIPFIGPYFDYSYGNDDTWRWTSARGWLEVLPGAAVVLGGLLLLLSANRFVASFGGWLAVAGGAWFVLGRSVADLLHIGSVGSPTATSDSGRAVAELGYFTALGPAIVLIAGFALGRLAVVGVRDVRVAERRARRRREAEEREAAAAAAASRHTEPANTARTDDTYQTDQPVRTGSEDRAEPANRPTFGTSGETTAGRPYSQDPDAPAR